MENDNTKDRMQLDMHIMILTNSNKWPIRKIRLSEAFAQQSLRSGNADPDTDSQTSVSRDTARHTAYHGLMANITVECANRLSMRILNMLAII